MLNNLGIGRQLSYFGRVMIEIVANLDEALVATSKKERGGNFFSLQITYKRRRERA
jgi:hypothetical protein